MINNVTLVGRLTKEPELKEANNASVCSFTIAVDRNYKNSAGERETDFIPITAWRKLAEICAKNLSKGRMVGITGRIQTRSWDTEDGKRAWAMEVVAENVVFLDKKKDD
ncbi:MAG TPA: single-stranded DNA-binding protein [Thermoanaerobacterales bacterium]|nr:single-stranded DNA-binding protein [Thermoanaerobacterales bacterium]